MVTINPADKVYYSMIRVVIVCSLIWLLTLIPANSQQTKKKVWGTIKGIVVDAKTGLPIPKMFVEADYLGDESDAKGHFEISLQEPGIHKVGTWRRDYVNTSKWVKVRSGHVSFIRLRAKRAAPAICKLAGNWSIQLTLETTPQATTPHLKKQLPKQSSLSSTRKQIEGTLVFDSSLPASDRRAPKDDPTLDEVGTFSIDFRPFWNKQVNPEGSTTIMPSQTGRDRLTEAAGYVCAGDSIQIDLIPTLSHGGISLEGHVRGDKITGKWNLRTYAGGEKGKFVMRRLKSNEKL